MTPYTSAFVLALLSLLPSASLAAPLGPDDGVLSLPLSRSLSPRWSDLAPSQQLHHHLRRAHTTHALAGIDAGSPLPTLATISTLLLALNAAAAALGPAAPVLATNGTRHLEAAPDGPLSPSSRPQFEPEEYHLGYVTTVRLGTPPRLFRLAVDSGSSDFWVTRSGCTNADNGNPCGDHVYLDPSTSTSFLDTHRPFSATYGNAAPAIGTLISERLELASVCVPDILLGVARQAPDFVAGDINLDGVIGTASSTRPGRHAPTLVETLHARGILRAPTVAYLFARHGQPSRITLGGLPPHLLLDWDTLSTAPNLSATGHWEAAVTILLDKGMFRLEGRTAVVDTGAAVLLAPGPDASAVHAAIPGARVDGVHGYVVPCNVKTEMALEISGQAFEITPKDLAFLPIEHGECVSAIQASQDTEGTRWLVGSVFLKNMLFAHDLAKNEMLFARLAIP